MRRLALPLAVLVVTLAGCSSSEPLSFDLARPMAPPPVPVTISGTAVDEGEVCSSGTVVSGSIEDMEGRPIELEEWGKSFDEALENGTVAELMHRMQVECADGSGTFKVIEHVRFDFAVIEVESLDRGRITNGTWTIEGTGEYESLTGSGQLVSDNDAKMIHAIGEVEA